MILRQHEVILLGQNENARHRRARGIPLRVEFSRNAPRDRTGYEPQIPPAISAEDELLQRYRVVKYTTCDRPARRHTKRGSRAEAVGLDEDRFAMRALSQRVISTQRSRSDA